MQKVKHLKSRGMHHHLTQLTDSCPSAEAGSHDINATAYTQSESLLDDELLPPRLRLLCLCFL
jgi:hypothetical protein